MDLIGTPNNYNLVDAKEEVFSTVNKYRKQNKNVSVNTTHLYDY